MIDVIIFGAGNQYKLYSKFDFVNVVGVVDNDDSKWGKSINGNVIESPDVICDKKYDLIVILCSYYNVIKSQLLEKYGIRAEKIKDFTYWDSYIINERYKRFYLKQNERVMSLDSINPNLVINRIDELMEKQIVVYTAITNNYDNLVNPLFTDKNIKYICYTDDDSLKSDIWEIRQIPNYIRKEKKCDRYIKMHPHELFPEYEISIWVDGKVIIKNDLRIVIKKYMKSLLLCCLQVERDKIEDELDYFIRIGKMSIKEKEELTSFLKMEGYHNNSELTEMRFIVRLHNDENIIKAMDYWWNIYKRFDERDQVTFGYVMWKIGLRYDIADLNVYGNEYWEQQRHN